MSYRRRVHIRGVVEWNVKGAPIKGFPEIEEVESADKEQLARWYRFLPSGETIADHKIMKRIADRFEKLDGMTAELSKRIGMQRRFSGVLHFRLLCYILRSN